MFLQDCTSYPGTQERLLSFKSKYMVQNEPGRVRETHLAALQILRQWREVLVHIKRASCQQAISGTRDSPSTTAQNSGRTHFPWSLGKPVHRALLRLDFSSEVNELFQLVWVSLPQCTTVCRTSPRTHSVPNIWAVEAPVIITGRQQGFLEPFSHRHSPLNDQLPPR